MLQAKASPGTLNIAGALAALSNLALALSDPEIGARVAEAARGYPSKASPPVLIR